METVQVTINAAVQSLSHVWLFVNPRTACQASLFFTISQNLLKLMFIESMMPSNHLILCHPLILLPSIFPSIRVFLMSQLFTSGGQSIRASASSSVLPMNIQCWFPSGLISLPSKGTLKSLLQHHILKASILWCSAFFMVQLSHPYRKKQSFDCMTFVSKVMSLLCNILSRFVIAFPLRNKCLLISWLQSPSTVILKFKKIKNKICHCFLFSPIHLSWSDETGTMILVFWMLNFKSTLKILLFHLHQGAL